MEPGDVKSPSVSVHTDDYRDMDMRGKFFDFMSDTETESLDDAVALNMKQAAAKERAYQAKIIEYHHALISS